MHHASNAEREVWAVEGSSALRALGVLPEQSSTRVTEGLGLGSIEEVNVVARGKAHDMFTNASTVGELLSAMRIEPDWDDRVDPPPTATLRPGSRVTYSAVAVHPQTIIGSGMVRQILIKTVNGRPVARRLLGAHRFTPPVPPHFSSTVGEASWYYIDDGLSAASPWLPFGTRVTVTNLATGATVTVVINDRGPFGGRLIDLSEEAFSHIAPLGQGVAQVRIAW